MTKADPSSWVEQTAKAVKGELDKVDLGEASGALHSADKAFSVWTQQAVVDTKSQIDKIDLGQVAEALDQGGKDILFWTEEAFKSIMTQTDKIDMSGANDITHEAASGLRQAVDNMGSEGFEGWLKQATKDVGLHTTLVDLQYVKVEELPEKTVKYIRENPGQTAFYVVNEVVLIAPVVVTGPLYAMFGFGAKGVRAASLAAKAQSLYGAAVPAGGVFAHLTSVAMGGYGVTVVNGVVQAGAAAGMAVKKAVDFAGGAASAHEEL
ncbi:hypothetical protein LTR02_003402 [Friedmanniomyces endolithicus]|nr:hypothetical protein LTR94_000407 [Friedmanniomyces endolithicus]KAK0788583.1 hypothetical protein LTR59_009973 [Friedmanniomyces endolithicus]KAK0802741.1 hypothetical protein LTR38_006437 [Friedmanniomyces endolithicus]KAK0808510.1 hypothetical protein LTR75_006217 [Friedmanniomyces endolithicus]KAK0849185.1 hypothetical protein LTS02_013704 [Friedmanniomyces endolithicus]